MGRNISKILAFVIATTMNVAAGTDRVADLAQGRTLDTVVAEALAKNPELNYYRAGIAVAKGDRRAASAFPNPEFGGQAGAKHADDPQTGATGTGLAVSVSISQTFEYPGRLALRKAIADRQIVLAELGYAQFRATLAAQTRATAYVVVVAEQNAAAAIEVANRFRKLNEVLRQREAAGVGPALEASIIEAQAATTERRANEAKLKASTALLKLNELRGERLSAPVKIAPIELSFRVPEPPEKLMSIAFEKSFELRIRQTELAQQGFKVSLAKNEKYPAFSVGPFYSHEQSGSVGEKQDIAGLSFSMPLPVWNRNTGNIATAEARQQQAEASFAISRREVELKVAENVAIYAAKVAELSQWERRSLEKLRDSAASADQHYRSGAIPLGIYVEIQKQYLEILEGVLTAKTEALGAAQELEILTGLGFFKKESVSRQVRGNP